MRHQNQDNKTLKLIFSQNLCNDNMRGSREGGQGGIWTPWKITKKKLLFSNISRFPGIWQSYQTSIHCRAIIGPLLVLYKSSVLPSSTKKTTTKQKKKKKKKKTPNIIWVWTPSDKTHLQCDQDKETNRHPPYMVNVSRDMWFPTMWHFDKCRLGRACAASC